MAQWHPGQQGFQYPVQTGYHSNPQLQQNPQFQPQNPQLQPQNPQFQPQQQFQSGGLGPPTPVGIPPQPTGFIGGRLLPQPTGFIGGNMNLGILPQPTGFLGGNIPYGGGVPPVPPLPQQQQQQNLFSSIGQLNPQQHGAPPQQLSWTLTKAEKKKYNDIFRSWDPVNTRFIDGATALNVFGASGLSQNDLARIWTLADIDDRGKLNIAEFHVAMGLIYRRLNGMPIPDQLPSELIPPSSRDLNDSVDLVKDLLKHETRSRSPTSLDSPISRLKNRSFNSSSPSVDANRDATIYKHSDDPPASGFYKPRSRHVDRDAIRSRDDDDSPAADLSDMKRRLANTAQMLERTAQAEASRTKEDEELDQEMDDLRYRVKRVQDDLDYNARPPRTSSKEEERRRLERELLSLMHERIPEVERKMKAREERKEREKRQWARDRDRTNDRHGRYDDKDDYYRRNDDRDRLYSRGDDRDRPYSRGAYDRDDRERDSYRRERSPSRSRDYERPRSSAARSPPPVSTPASSVRETPPIPQQPKATASPRPDIKNMTAAERQAFIKAEGQRLTQARMAALGVTASSSSTNLDTSVEDRLQQEKKEAEEKAKAAEKQAEVRERARKERLDNERSLKEGKTTPAPPSPTITAPSRAPAPKAIPKAAPAPPKRAPAPPPPRKVPRASPAVVSPPPAPKPPAVVIPSEPEIDREEELLRAREAELRKKREEREAQFQAKLKLLEAEEEEARRQEEERKKREDREAQFQAKLKLLEAEEEEARRQEEERKKREEKEAQFQAKLKLLEAEEEEARRQEEERYQARLQALKAKTVKPPTPPVERTPPLARKAPKAPSPVVQHHPASTIQSPPPPPAPPAPAISPIPSPAPEKSTNPFSRLIKEGGNSASTPSVANGSSNPWSRSPTAQPPSGLAPSKSPVSNVVKTDYNTAPSSLDDDWDEINENDGSDASSDDEIAQSRTARANIAQQLFGNILPRPTSAAASAPSSPAPPPPPPPPALSASAASTAPIPPITPPSGNDVSALMQSIQGGMKLRPTKTVVKSAPGSAGKVIGEVPPPHISASVESTARPSIIQSRVSDNSSYSGHRQSTGWLTDRAIDVNATSNEIQRLPSTMEDNEELSPPISAIPKILVEASAIEPVSDLMADIDKSIQQRVRSLYAFEGDGPEDLSFGENLIIIANPSKSGGDWWYGTIITSSKSGLFPKTYVEIVEPRKAKAIYSYASDNSDELTFAEGDILSIVDNSEEEWWKAEQGGVVFIVPAAYLEVVEG